MTTNQQFPFRDMETRTPTSGSYVGCCEYTHSDSVLVFRRVHVDGVPNFVSEAVVLTREQARYIAAEIDRWLVVTAAPDPAYEAWVAGRQRPLGVGPLDVEDPASRFASEEPSPEPATLPEWAERLASGGGAS